MGTPAYALPLLNSLSPSWADLVGVYTAPDRPRGRGLSKGFSPVKEFALQEKLPLFQPASLRTAKAQEEFLELAPDLVVVAAFGRIVPTELLNAPKHGFVNVHPSLLPKYRGPSPVVTAILDGVEETGVSLMLLDEGIDSGPVLAQQQTPIGPDEMADNLTTRLFEMGGGLLAKTLPLWMEGQITPAAQDHTLATYTNKVVKGDGEVDWGEDAASVVRRIRAFTPWPGLYTRWRGRVLKLLSLETLPGKMEGKPGAVVALADSIPGSIAIVAVGGSMVKIGNLQLEGRRVQNAEEFLRGYPDFPGSHLPS